MKANSWHWAAACVFAFSLPGSASEAPELIVHHAKIVTVDDQFSLREAMAIREGRVVAVGRNDEVLKNQDEHTRLLDLGGGTVLPGLMDSHTHPTGAAMTELERTIPEFESVKDVLNYLQGRAQAAAEGEWITMSQVFITRLREQRYPTREELDRVAPKNPVIYRTGPDAALNSLALKLSGIDRDFKVTDGGTGFIEKDAQTGEPNGVLRNCTRFVKVKTRGEPPTEAQQLERLAGLFHDYNSVGLTSIADRDSSPPAMALYTALRDRGDLTVRVSISPGIGTTGAIEGIQGRIRRVAEHSLFKDKSGPVRIIGTKIYLDGGMLTGSAYMREPWGVSKMYGITDPAYRGVLFVPKERLLPMVRTAVESGLQFTAHSVGDGAVQTLLDVYEEVGRELPIRATRPCITHANFQSQEAVWQAARLGVVMDLQPAWLYLDTRTLSAQFGNERLRWFQPLQSLFAAGVIVGGGSDHMQKIGSLRSINPYNPFLGLWTAITRQARWFEGRLHPEEALTREEAIRFYTRNNAHLLFCENELGSLELGKRADFIVLDRDILTCPQDEIRDIQVRETYLGGKRVFERK
jgi:predicted amidohydrolase YtcJ